MVMALPTGRRGKAMAVAITGLGLALVWLGAIVPLMNWHASLDQTRNEREVLASRMQALTDSLPRLKQQIQAEAAHGQQASTVIPGATDAIASASLQGQVEDMARKAGVTLTSAEALPAVELGQYRRIGLRLVVDGKWAVLVPFLHAIEQANPRMLIDDLQLQRGAVLTGADMPLSGSLSVYGFRSTSK